MANVPKPKPIGIKHGQHGDKFGQSKATPMKPMPKVPGINAPMGGHKGSHDGVTREHGADGKK